ncbi:LacI family DNA-binding transcriptional regulator [Sporolactobacillus shoreicorticis]|uniref:LacI family DNA-binding transcriptional regulator n=1 Tax=Sporolactobacillus shoreicorticis TaxID=1923877 RepID=A0ABW5S2I8_9BACL|nr:LacI family DNA-binding transcriptional regulator [Sporolactobacillus shoreicorticis]MCO7128099.1 LacI family DNA-binding transcriptional regulator [Sporolactobacillus shoreicorticis]
METEETSKHATISIVAKKAGVSTTTISRYLNEKYEYMSLKTRRRIEAVIDELNYRPSNIARGLKSKKTNQIGVIVADIENPFSSMMMKGVNDVCNRRNYHMLILNTDNSQKSEEEGVLSLIDHNVDALLINPTGYSSSIYAELKNNDLPVVLIDRQIEHPFFDLVTSNNYDVTYQATAYLIKNNYSRIYFVTENIDSISTRSIRKKAVEDALREKGLDHDQCLMTIDKNNTLDIKEKLMKIKRLHGNEKIALFAVNGQILLVVLQMLHELRLSIPSEIGIYGYDDWGWGELISPGITVIQQDPYGMGIKAAELLIDRLEGKRKGKSEVFELPANLIIRGSTD